MNAPLTSRTMRMIAVVREHRGPVVIGVVVVAAGVVVMWLLSGDGAPPPKQVRELTVNVILPPPPPPPPPEQKVVEQKMLEQPKMIEPEIKQDKPLDEPKPDTPKDDAPPPGPLALDAKGEGPGDSFGLGGKLGGHGLFGGSGGASRWGWYASMVQAQIESALRANAKTRNAVMEVRVRLWADGAGRVTRVQLIASTGDAELDGALREGLQNLSLREAPPTDMPMPIVTRITSRRPT